MVLWVGLFTPLGPDLFSLNGDKLMKLRVIYNSRLVRKGYTAWVLFPFMFIRHAKEDFSDRLFRHEMEHVYQVMRDGWWVFYVKYLYWLARYGYMDNPYEVEARSREDEPLTTTERFFKES